jgi:Family of unknown function (DUF6510)
VTVQTSDLTLDGNALGGLLAELFAQEMTAARSTCASCGAVGEVATLVVYVQAPGTVVRCPACGAILARVVQADGRTWVDLRGVACLEIHAGT